MVPHAPWVEHADIALESEVLTLDVHEDAVDVEALFRFRVLRETDDFVATFPIASPRGGGTGFEARIGEDVVQAVRAEPGGLPVGEAVESWDIPVDVHALGRAGGILRVRYTQRGRGDFAYLWRTGAHWRGPIRRLDVVVHDTERRVAALAIDDEDVATSRRAEDGTITKALFDVEPKSGLKLHVR